MNFLYPFESVLVRNRLGKGMRLLVHPFSLSMDHVCILVTTPSDVHNSTLTKNADYFVSQLRERFSRTVKTFSMIELRIDADGLEHWYAWQFNWVGNTPLEPKSIPLSLQQQHYYQGLIMGFDRAAGAE
jgi:hypothetical protein